MNTVVDAVLQAVCEECRVSRVDVVSLKRHPEILRARRLFIVVVRDHSRLSFGEIAGMLGKTTASSWVERCMRAKELFRDDPEFRAAYDRVTALAGVGV